MHVIMRARIYIKGRTHRYFLLTSLSDIAFNFILLGPSIFLKNSWFIFTLQLNHISFGICNIFSLTIHFWWVPTLVLFPCYYGYTHISLCLGAEFSRYITGSGVPGWQSSFSFNYVGTLQTDSHKGCVNSHPHQL